MPTVLITGATSPVGSRFGSRFKAQGYAVRGLVDPAAAWPTDPGFERIDGSLADDAIVAASLAGCDVVVNLAQEGLGSGKGAERMWQTNALCTERLARAARAAGVGRFLHVSTTLTIGGSRRARILDESADYDLQRYRLHYAASRRAGEAAVLAEVERGLDAVVVNPGAMLGPDTPLMNAASRLRLRVCPPGGFNVVDVRDVVGGCLQAIEHGRTGHRYILGGENITGRNFIWAMQRAAGHPPPRWTMPTSGARVLATIARATELVRPMRGPVSSQMLRMFPLFFWFSSRKAEDELGYRSSLPLADLETWGHGAVRRDEATTVEKIGTR